MAGDFSERKLLFVILRRNTVAFPWFLFAAVPGTLERFVKRSRSRPINALLAEYFVAFRQTQGDPELADGSRKIAVLLIYLSKLRCSQFPLLVFGSKSQFMGQLLEPVTILPFHAVESLIVPRTGFSIHFLAEEHICVSAINLPHVDCRHLLLISSSDDLFVSFSSS